jgi:sensor histidine kinase YesM
MMLQSLVENAIKHGLECKAEGGTIKFRAEVAHNKLRVSVTDDGLGFGAMPSNGTGLGLQNIRERLKLIYKEKGTTDHHAESTDRCLRYHRNSL